MGFCKFSSEYIINNNTSVDNTFINDFLPKANSDCVKVYLYGLLKCANALSYDNTIQNFSSILNISEQDIMGAFEYWENEGLVKILSTDPFEIVYLSPSKAISSSKKYDPEKFKDFNFELENIMSGRPISLNEYNKYYDFIETYHFEPMALIEIAEYCLRAKGKMVGCNYIITVAKNWADEGLVSCEKINDKLNELEQNLTEIGELFKALGIKRLASIEEKEFLIKWKTELDFSLETIIYIAKKLKKTQSKLVTFEKLDSVILKYYEMKIYTILEIEKYDKEKEIYFSASKNVCKELGLYYENLEPVISNYTSKWFMQGYDEKMLLQIANLCFKNSIKTLEGMNTYIQKLFKLGIVCQDALNEYLSEILAEDNEIKQILIELGIVRNVNSLDRSFYKTWVCDWNMPKEFILEGVKLAKNQPSPMQYLNKILSTWHNGGAKTLKDVQKISLTNTSNSKIDKVDHNFQKHSYTKEDLNALFDNLEEIDL